MGSGLHGPYGTISPAAHHRPYETFQVLAGQFINIVKRKAGIAAIQAGQGLVRGIAVAARSSACCGRAAVPGRTFVNGMAIGIAHVEEQTMAHLVRQLSL